MFGNCKNLTISTDKCVGPSSSPTSQLKIRVPMQVSSTVYQSKIPTEIELNRNQKKQIQLKRLTETRSTIDEYDKIIFHVANPITCNCTTNTSTMYCCNLQIMHLMYHNHVPTTVTGTIVRY